MWGQPPIGWKPVRKKPVVVLAKKITDRKEIQTLEGTMIAEPGDYLICGVHGEYYPCKPDIFAETYEDYEGEYEIVTDLEGNPVGVAVGPKQSRAKKGGNGIELSTGKFVYANFNIFGLDDEFNLTEGLDGTVEYRDNAVRRRNGTLPNYDPDDPDDVAEFLTNKERLEIAEEMINRWERYRDMAKTDTYDKETK